MEDVDDFMTIISLKKKNNEQTIDNEIECDRNLSVGYEESDQLYL